MAESFPCYGPATGPKSFLFSPQNVKECQWRSLLVTWFPSTRLRDCQGISWAFGMPCAPFLENWPDAASGEAASGHVVTSDQRSPPSRR